MANPEPISQVYDFSITMQSPSPTSIQINLITNQMFNEFKLYKYSENTKEYEFLALIGNGNPYIDEGLSPSTKYTYKIAYIDEINMEHFIEDTITARTSPYIIAHRGYWNVDGSAENSIQSLKMAANIGVYGSEFDVHVTTDGVPVVYHDNYIKDTNINIQYARYYTMKDYILSNGERLPTLSDYLQAGKLLPIKLLLDYKSDKTGEQVQKAVQKTISIVKEYGMEDKIFYFTDNLEAGKEFIRLLPGNTIGYFVGDNLPPNELKNNGFSALGYYYQILQNHPEYVDEANNLGIKLGVWTVNDLNLIENMFNSGIRFIITDIPLIAKNYLEQKRYVYNFIEE